MAAKQTKKQKRESIEKSLQTQLKALQADVPHFNDLIDTYMAMWDTQEGLKKDIKKRGVKCIEMMSTGVEKTIDNPAIKDMVTINKQMILILKELHLTTDESTGKNDVEL